jgi:ATP-dependent Lon protease
MIPGPLRDRMEVIRLSGYTLNEKMEIAKRHLIPELLEIHGLKPEQLSVEDEALRLTISDYTAEAGVRNLEQKLATINRKVARKVAAEGDGSWNVTVADVESYLGLPAFEHEFAERSPEIGVATGLAWTSFGGEIMFIEATRMKGSGRTIVTGQLGDVMRESVQAAYSYVRAKAGELEIDDKFFGEYDVHIHFPAGAIPKDGPSAGVAIATTIASVMGEKPIRHDVAMTGEITLRGKVLSVGGIKEKVMAAQRANIKTVVLPVGNKRDLTEVPPEVKAGLNFVFAERMEDVWRETLIPIVVSKGEQRKFDQTEFDADRRRAEERPESR